MAQEVFQRRLEPWKWGAPWLAIRRWQWPTERILKANPLTTYGRSCLRTQHWLLCGHLAFEAKWKGGKARNVSASLADHKSKNCHFGVSSSPILCNSSEPFIGWIVTCDKKWILYNNQQQPTQWLDSEEAPKHFPKPNLPPKKIHGHWCFAAGLIHYSFLNPSATMTYKKYAQQTDEMHWKLHGLPPAPVNREGPVLLCDSAWLRFAQPVIHKLNELGYKVLPHLPYSPNLSPTA